MLSVLEFSQCPYFSKEDDKLNILFKDLTTAKYYLAHLFFIFTKLNLCEMYRIHQIRCDARNTSEIESFWFNQAKSKRVKSRPALPFSRFVLLLGQWWNNWDSGSKWFGRSSLRVWSPRQHLQRLYHPTWTFAFTPAQCISIETTHMQRCASMHTCTGRARCTESSCLCRGHYCKRIPLAGALSASINLSAFDRNYVHLFSHSHTQRLQLRLPLQASGLAWATHQQGVSARLPAHSLMLFSAILNDGLLNAAIVWTLSEWMHHVTRLQNHGGGLPMVGRPPACFRSWNVFKDGFCLIPSSNIPC